MIKRASGLFDTINTLLIVAHIYYYEIIFGVAKHGIFN